MDEKYIECRDCQKSKLFTDQQFTISRNKLTDLCRICAADRRKAVLLRAKEKYDSVSHENDYKNCTKCNKSKLNTPEFFSVKYGIPQATCLDCISKICKEKHTKKVELLKDIPYCVNADINKLITCRSCEKDKPFTNEYFSVSHNLVTNYCKECKSRDSKDSYYRNWDAAQERSRKYEEKHKEKMNAWRKSPEARAAENERRKKPEYKKKSNENEKRRRKEDKQYQVKKNLRCRLSAAMKSQIGFKRGKSEELLGCSYEVATAYFESKFTEGMSWDLYGFGEGKFNLEHVVPCTAFNLENDIHAKQCFHYTNVIPMWHEDNVAKSDWITYNGQQVRARTLTKQQKHAYISSLNLPPYEVPNHSAAPYNPLINQIRLDLPIQTLTSQIVNNPTILATNLPIRAPIIRRVDLVG